MINQLIAVMASPRIVPVQIDDFPHDCERSRPGAVHFQPGVVTELTPAEYDHIRIKHPELAVELVLLNRIVNGPAVPLVSVDAPDVPSPDRLIESQVKTLRPPVPDLRPKDDDEEWP